MFESNYLYAKIYKHKKPVSVILLLNCKTWRINQKSRLNILPAVIQIFLTAVLEHPQGHETSDMKPEEEKGRSRGGQRSECLKEGNRGNMGRRGSHIQCKQ